MIGLKSGPGGGAVRSKVLEFKKGCVEMKMWGKDGVQIEKSGVQIEKSGVWVWYLKVPFAVPKMSIYNIKIWVLGTEDAQKG